MVKTIINLNTMDVCSCNASYSMGNFHKYIYLFKYYEYIHSLGYYYTDNYRSCDSNINNTFLLKDINKNENLIIINKYKLLLRRY